MIEKNPTQNPDHYFIDHWDAIHIQFCQWNYSKFKHTNLLNLTINYNIFKSKLKSLKKWNEIYQNLPDFLWKFYEKKLNNHNIKKNIFK